MRGGIGFVLVLVLLVLTVVAVKGVSGLSSNYGCPDGTQFQDTGLVQLCNGASGNLVCVQWATGFTPVPADARLSQDYVRDNVPEIGPWCRHATSPPPGDGGGK